MMTATTSPQFFILVISSLILDIMLARFPDPSVQRKRVRLKLLRE